MHAQAEIAEHDDQPEKARILLVDDDTTLLKSLRRRLQERFEVRIASSAREALTVMRDQAPFAAVVADMTMPDTDGATLLGEVKRSFPGTVRLMLTGHDQRDVVTRAVNECEVYRFLIKPCPSEELERALEDAVELHGEWAASERSSVPLVPGDTPAPIPSARRFDTTSGLPNRRTFEATVHGAITGLETVAPWTLIHLDMDDFGLVNETCGFEAGDALLRHAAAAITRSLPTPSHLARLSEDEFGILLSGENAAAAEQVCKRVLDAIGQSPFSWNGQAFAISACAGIVPLAPEFQGVAAWLLSAEAACDVAKNFGPGRLYMACQKDPQLERLHSERHWLSKIEQAIHSNAFRLMYQRIAPLHGPEDGPMHFELLLRMVQDSGTLISPSSFMPAAERHHRAAAVDRWVVRNAFEWLASDQQRLRRISLCSVNLSAGSLCDPDFVSFLVETLRTSRARADRICLEITETAAMAEMDAAVRVIGDLRALGLRFALDDFGSGLCSFAYLKNLPVDYLKIDGSFVKQLDKDPTSRAMVQSINQIGQVTGKKTIAEFVENEKIANVLRRIGVDFGQGYGIHRPAPLESL